MVFKSATDRNRNPVDRPGAGDVHHRVANNIYVVRRDSLSAIGQTTIHSQPGQFISVGRLAAKAPTSNQSGLNPAARSLDRAAFGMLPVTSPVTERVIVQLLYCGYRAGSGAHLMSGMNRSIWRSMAASYTSICWPIASRV